MINSYDIETFKFNNMCFPFCISYNFNNVSKSFYWNKKKENDIVLISILNLFEDIGVEAVFFIHNLKFDGTLIIDSLSKSTCFKFECLIENRNIYVITIFFNNKKLIFRCSYKILPLSLETIASGFALPSKIDFPYFFINKKTLFWKKFIPIKFFKTENGFLFYNRFKNIKKFTILYCETDCLITKKFIEIIHLFFLNNLKINFIKQNLLSTASLSHYTFYKKFNIKKIEKTISKEKELYIRDSYFGGRCEVFGNPTKKYIYYFDFAGMYSLCMKQKNVYGSAQWHHDINPNEPLKPGFYNINWESNNFLPILPHHNVINNKLLFTNGIGSGTYWFEEIELFRKMGGTILNINSGLVYPNFDYIFNDFIAFFEKFRSINKVYKTFGKLIINSFYGRTGLRIKQEHSFFVYTENELSNFILLCEKNSIEVSNIDKINNIWFLTIKLTEQSFLLFNELNFKIRKEKIHNIAIASSIASKARIKLYEAFLSIQHNNGRILYCDTDSIFAEFNENVDNAKHGEVFWDINNDETRIKDAVFCAPKTYGVKYFNDRASVKIKGVNRDFITFDEFKTHFYEKQNIKVFNLTHIKNIKFKIEYQNINKVIDLLGYDKRKFNDNLITTAPYKYLNGIYS